MRSLIIVVPFMRVDGMALYPFILVRQPALKDDVMLIHHERIHLKQQLELLVLPFYLLYLLNYLFNLLRFKNHHAAYLNIVFEKEANAHEANPAYLGARRFWAWLKYC
jgi:hypothetical protein